MSIPEPPQDDARRNTGENMPDTGPEEASSEKASPIPSSEDERIRHQLSVQKQKAERQKQKAEQKSELLHLMQTVASAANEADSFEAALQTAVDAVCRYTGWPVGHVYRRSEEDNELLLHPTEIWYRGLRDGISDPPTGTERRTFAPGEGFIGEVFEKCRPIWIDDVTEEPTFLRTSIVEEFPVRGAFAFPVPIEEEVVAVLEFYSKEVEPPDEELLEAMGSVGIQLGRVAERERARRALEASEALYRSLKESTPDGIVIADRNGEIVDWNRGAREIFAYEKGEIVGHPIEMLLPDRYKDRYRREMKLVHRTGRGRYIGETVETEGLRKSGEEFPMELSLSSWKAREGRYFAAIIRDITEHKELQQELLQVQEEERQRLGQELHDSLASQLTGASLKLGLFTRKADSEESAEALEEIQTLLKEASEDVRRLSRGLNPAGLSEGELLSALQGLAKNADGARLETDRLVENPSPLPLDEDEATHLYRIAQEATRNAQKYAQAEEIEIRLRRKEHFLVLDIEDNGIGFDPDLPREEGLGLRSMHRRAELLGAELKVETRAGHGTLVRCSLPT